MLLYLTHDLDPTMCIGSSVGRHALAPLNDCHRKGIVWAGMSDFYATDVPVPRTMCAMADQNT